MPKTLAGTHAFLQEFAKFLQTDDDFLQTNAKFL